MCTQQQQEQHIPAVVDYEHILLCVKFLSNLMLAFHIQGGSNMTGTNCDLFTHKSSRSYMNHLVLSKLFVNVHTVLT
jgi:hypothetical protein